jgi:tagatose-1,6-bisphosphate aldolase
MPIRWRRPPTPDGIALQRRLARLAGADGVVLGLAIDHRDSMLGALRRAGLDHPSAELIAAIKSDVCRAIGPLATAIMLDAEYGRAALDEGAVPAPCGLIMPLEAQGYDAAGDAQLTTLMPDFAPAVAARSFGADACKLLLPFRAGEETAAQQLRTAQDAIELSHEQGLPLVLEPIIYRKAGESEESFWAGHGRVLVDSVSQLADLAPDLFKLPFPAWTADVAGAAQACRALNDACRGIRWVLLGGGAAQDEMEAQVRMARDSGAIGFLVGRTLWSSALLAAASERRGAISQRVIPAFRRLAEIAVGV